MFNSRSDNLVKLHGPLLDNRRCVVVLRGFFEWVTEVGPGAAAGRKKKTLLRAQG